MAMNNYIEDDWNDNTLSSRSDPEKGVYYSYSSGGTGNLLKGVYRPRWNEIHSGDLNLTNSVIEAGSSSDYIIATKSVLKAGIMEIDYRFVSNSSNNGADRWWFGVEKGSDYSARDSGNNETHWHQGYCILFNDTGGHGLELYDVSSANSYGDRLISASDWSQDGNWHTDKLVRDVYGSWELFTDGASEGTTTSMKFTNFSYVSLTGDCRQTHQYDNLMVY